MKGVKDLTGLPVDEIVCGVRFRPIETSLELTVKVWQAFNPPFTRIEQKGLLPPPQFVPGEVRLETEIPFPRVWFVHESLQWVIQAQHDAFLTNWRAGHGSDMVPPFDRVLSEFLERLSRFEACLAREGASQVKPTQWELSYIIRVSKEHGWKVLEEVGDIFPDFQWRDREGKHPLEVTSFNWLTQFVYPGIEGYVTARIATAKHRDTHESLLRFEVNAIDVLSATPALEMEEWFREAHPSLMTVIERLANVDALTRPKRLQ